VQQHLPRVIWGIPKATIKQSETNRAIEKTPQTGLNVPFERQIIGPAATGFQSLFSRRNLPKNPTIP